MAKTKPTVTLTYAVTIPQIQGKSIAEIRAALLEAVDILFKGTVDMSKVKVHLTNKETHYAQR